MGDIVFIQLPSVGASVATQDSFSEIESTKSVNDVYAPFAGTIVSINDALSATPELLNTDPYGDGWIAVIELADESELTQLMDAAAYEKLAAEGGH